MVPRSRCRKQAVTPSPRAKARSHQVRFDLRALQSGKRERADKTPRSESQLCYDLNQAWRRSADDIAESGVIDVAINRLRAVKLRMIECVECLDAELKNFGLGQLDAFLERQIEIIDSRSREKTASAVSDGVGNGIARRRIVGG